jgi:predicted ABC-type ATPase
VELSLARVVERARAGGHDVPADAVHRRFNRGFFTISRPLADAWRLYDATPITGPTLVAADDAGLPTRVRRREIWEMAAKDSKHERSGTHTHVHQ